MTEFKDQEIQLRLNCNISYIFKDLYYLELGLCLDFVGHIFHTSLSNKDKGITIIRRKKSSQEIKRLLDQPMPHWVIVSETFPYPEKQNDRGQAKNQGARNNFQVPAGFPLNFLGEIWQGEPEICLPPISIRQVSGCYWVWERMRDRDWQMITEHWK